MALRGKTIAALALASLGIAGVASAASAKKKRKPQVVDEDEDLETEAEEEASDEDDVIVDTPNKAMKLVVNTKGDEDEQDADPVLIAPDKKGGTPVDKKLEKLAKQEGKGLKEATSDVVKHITQGQAPSPIAAAEMEEDVDPDGTIALARLLLTREAAPNWKQDMQEDVKEWQEDVGLTPDGKFGIKSAARMAQEVGYLPLIRFWPKGTGSKKSAEQAYDRAINDTIQNHLVPELPDSKMHIAGLKESMKRENAVSYGKANPSPQDTLNFVQEVSEMLAQAAEEEAEKDLNS